jgi:hypothetical protein
VLEISDSLYPIILLCTSTSPKQFLSFMISALQFLPAPSILSFDHPYNARLQVSAMLPYFQLRRVDSQIFNIHILLMPIAPARIPQSTQCDVPKLSYHPTNIWWAVQIPTFLIRPPSSPLSSKHTPQHCLL